MKILYAIQGTGNGHVARAYEVVPQLQKHGEVDILISGTQCDIELPWKVTYRFHGMGFIFGKKGGVDIPQTVRQIKLFKFIKEMLSVPVQSYDLVINDFEPVVAWACKLKQVRCIGLSHQSAVLNSNTPKPEVNDWFGRGILKHYAPTSSNLGFHFKAIAPNITTPVIRKDIRHAKTNDFGHYTVYLPAYSDEVIMDVLMQLPQAKWEVFSKHTNSARKVANMKIMPVAKKAFTDSMLNARGVLCNAGFETPAEALYLGKKLCVIPMHGQYEQQCNAAFLKSMGITVLTNLEEEVDKIHHWIKYCYPLQINYPDNLSRKIEELVYANSEYASPYHDIVINTALR